ncbi:MAG: tetratricopeptide repeat protein [Promethearchaeota archaeon]
MVNTGNGEIYRAEKLIEERRFEEAHQILKTAFQRENLAPLDQLTCQILRSTVLSHLGQHEEALKLAEGCLKESKRLKESPQQLDSYIANATVLYELGKVKKCLEMLQEAETLLVTTNNIQEPEKAKREATIHFLKGKILGTKGDSDLALEHLNKCLAIRRAQRDFYGLGEVFNTLGIIYGSTGKYVDSLTSFQQMLTLFEELGNKYSIARALNNLGMTYWLIGELDQALSNYTKALELSQELGNKYLLASLSMNTGLIYQYKGELSSALNFYQKAFVEFEELESKREIVKCLTNIGNVHKMRGDIDQALQFYRKGLKIREEPDNVDELEINIDVAFLLNSIANVYQMKGELRAAMDSFKKSLGLFEGIGNNLYISLPLFNLVQLSVLIESREQTHSYLQQLQKINDKEDNKYIRQRYHVANALVLKRSSRLRDRSKAEELFEQVAKEEIINHELTVMALLNLCDILIDELRLSGSSEVLDEVQAHVSRLLNIAKEQHSYWLLVEIYLLKSKLALLELNMQDAQRFLEQAQFTALERGLHHLLIKVLSEQDKFHSQMNQWEFLISQNAPISELLELAQLEKLLMRVAQKRLEITNEDIVKYAQQAQQLKKEWENEL